MNNSVKQCGVMVHEILGREGTAHHCKICGQCHLPGFSPEMMLVSAGSTPII